MFASFLIPFRESLEAALVVGIVIAFLTKTNQQAYKLYVWAGVISGIVFSLLLGVGITLMLGGLSGYSEKFFEGILLFITAGFISWMILWVHRQKNQAARMRLQVKNYVEKGYGLGILLLVAIAIIREGTETVLYLHAVGITAKENQTGMIVLGIGSAIVLGYLLYKSTIRLSLRILFEATSILLLFFAAGLVSHGVHEFQELGLIPVFSFDPLFNISHILDHKGVGGSILRTLFGYTSQPTFFELLSYEIYLIGLMVMIQYFERKLKKRYSLDKRS